MIIYKTWISFIFNLLIHQIDTEIYCDTCTGIPYHQPQQNLVNLTPMNSQKNHSLYIYFILSMMWFFWTLRWWSWSLWLCLFSLQCLNSLSSSLTPSLSNTWAAISGIKGCKRMEHTRNVSMVTCSKQFKCLSLAGSLHMCQGSWSLNSLLLHLMYSKMASLAL